MTLNKKKKKAISIHIMYDNTSGSDIHVTTLSMLTRVDN